ncbi:MAG: hypothetical protein AB2708_04140, partial [Candidatus Thiodiazotropha taylori]
QGTVVTFSCNAGFNLFGGNRLTCQADSTWDLPNPVCKQGELFDNREHVRNDILNLSNTLLFPGPFEEMYK